MQAILRPGLALMGRLPMARKITVVVLATVMALGVLLAGAVQVQYGQVRFSEKERVGVRYVAVALDLMVALTRRDLAQREGGDVPSLDAELAAMRAEQAQDGEVLATAEHWAATEELVVTAAGLTGEQGLEANRAASLALASLIARAGETSNLLLDPDVDSYYLMDAVVARIPALLDLVARSTGYTLDAKALSSTGGAAFQAQRLLLARTNGELDVSMAGLRVAHDTSLAATDHPAVVDAVSGPYATAAKEGDRFSTIIAGNTTGGGSSLVDLPATDYVDALQALAAVDIPALDALIADRVDGLWAGAARVAALALAAAVLVSYLLASLGVYVSRGVRAMTTAVDAVATGDLTARALLDARDEIGQMGRALDGAVTSVQDALQQVHTHANAITASSATLFEASGALERSAAEAARRADEIGLQAGEVSTNVGHSAAGTEEMTVAIAEIARAAEEAAVVATSAAQAARDTQGIVQSLTDSSDEIGDVVSVIASITGQTHLLALNATIEAARAGESGRGFAVVADQVKELSRETAGATDGIRSRVGAMQTGAGEAVTAIDTISGIVERIQELQGSIAGAVSEQSATADEMGRSITLIVGGSMRIAEDIDAVAASVATAADTATTTREAAQQLATTADALTQAVGRFRLD